MKQDKAQTTTITHSRSRNHSRKKQADRLLKQLPLSDRRRQRQIRQQIVQDLAFAAI